MLASLLHRVGSLVPSVAIVAAVASCAGSPPSAPCPCGNAPTAAAIGSAGPIAVPPADVATFLREREAVARADAARRKLGKKEGPGCLADLDAHDQLDRRAEQQSTDPESAYAWMRASCLFAAGRCDEGRKLATEAYRGTLSTLGPEGVANAVDAMVMTSCQSKDASRRDQFLRATSELQAGAWQRTLAPADCQRAFDTAKAKRPATIGDDDAMAKSADQGILVSAPACFAKAGDCASAWRVYEELWRSKVPGNAPKETLRSMFDSTIVACRGKL